MTTVRAHPNTWEVVCETCREAKVREQFERYASGNLRSECRSCVSRKRQDAKREWNRRQRETDPNGVRLADRVRYAANRETILERSRRYHAENREARCERSRKWREANPDAVVEYQAMYREMNRSRINEAAREYRRRKK